MVRGKIPESDGPLGRKPRWSFPAGRHDDQVDALGLVGQLLDKINAGQKPKPLEQPQRDGYRAAFEEMPDDSWKTM